MPEPEVQASAAPAAAAPRPAALFTPVSLVLTAVLVLFTGILTHLVTRAMGGDKPLESPLIEDVVQVNLGELQRDIPADDLGKYKEKFFAKLSVILNPRFSNVVELAGFIEKRKDSFTYVVQRDIIYKKNPEEFRKDNFLSVLEREIKHRLNEEIQWAGDGQEVIERVIFKSIVLPQG